MNKQKVRMLTLFGISSVIFLLFIGTNFWFSQQNVQIKQQLELELTQLPLPKGCRETSRTYQDQKPDLQAQWFLVYSCNNVTSKAAFKTLTQALLNRRYTLLSDSSKAGQGLPVLAYNFSFHNNNFVVNYRFYPETPIAEKDIAQLEQRPVEQIALSLQKSR